MTRRQRIHYPGALYHVVVRGNNREKVFAEEIQKEKYLKILTKYKQKQKFMVFAYCILDNHAHILIEVSDTPLSKIMQSIQQTFTQWVNRKYQRTGHVFQQRYNAFLCNKQNYLLQLIKYIHNNPVKAGIEEGINYKWSSHLNYLGLKSEIVDISYGLSMFKTNKGSGIVEYLNFIGSDNVKIEYINTDAFKPTQNFKQNLEDFIEPSLEQKQNQFFDTVEKTKNKLHKNDENTAIDEIIQEVCIKEDVTKNEILKKTRRKKIPDIRKAIVILIKKKHNVSNIFLSEKLNLSPSMISKIITGESKGSDYVNEVIKRLESE